ncbi:MAG: hypothetical protein ACE5E7_01930 [Anaerolineae bacterium]
MSEEISELKDAENAQAEGNWFSSEQRHSNWIVGVVLIIIGVVFLFSNLVDFSLNNWWALFILIPAVHNFGNAWNSYRRHGRLSHSARSSLTGGLFITLVASAFLFSLDWGLIWPWFLIIGGLSALLGSWFD